MAEISDNHKPFPENVPGDFYVEADCCTMCEAPFAEAPGMFGVADDPTGYTHCYIKRQPQSPAEFEQMISAIQVAELECIRYRGSDRLVQLQILANGQGLVCDNLPPDLQQEADRQEREREKYWERRQGPWWKFWQ